MEKNKFEKQVQERMAGLKIQPSPKNWSEIERRIRKRRFDKRVIWLLMAVLFLVAGGGYFWFQQNQLPEPQIAQQPSTIFQNKQDSGDQKNSTNFPENQVDSNSITKDENITSSAISNSNQISGENQRETLAKSPVKKMKGQGISEAAEYFSNEQVKENTIQVISIQATDTTSNLHGHEISVSTSEEKNKMEKIELPVLLLDPDEPGLVVTDSTFFRKRINSRDKPITFDQKKPVNMTMGEENGDSLKSLHTDKKGIVKITKPEPSAKNKWEWGVSVSAGKAILGEGINFALLENNKAFDLSSADPNLSPNFSQSYIMARPAAVRISHPKSSVGFNAGLVVKRDLYDGLAFQTGLTYKYYSNTIQLSTPSFAGTGSMTFDADLYRNNFHFIEWPLLAEFRLNKNKKMPLKASVGTTISHLLVSDAVELKGGYFVRDGASLNKTQIGLSVGLSATFFNKFSVGPFMNYGLNKIAHEGIFENKHWNYVGLKLEYLLK